LEDVMTGTDPQPPYAGDLSPAQAWELLVAEEGAVLVDVRTQAEWRFVGVPDTGSLPAPSGPRTVQVEWVSYPAGARNPGFLDELAAQGVTGGTGRAVLFLCRSGVRSIAAATAATAAGIGPSFNILEGFEGDVGLDGHRGHGGWRASGLPWRQG
jgi:rhodanese-related sulfurtransferase